MDKVHDATDEPLALALASEAAATADTKDDRDGEARAEAREATDRNDTLEALAHTRPEHDAAAPDSRNIRTKNTPAARNAPEGRRDDDRADRAEERANTASRSGRGHRAGAGNDPRANVNRTRLAHRKDLCKTSVRPYGNPTTNNSPYVLSCGGPVEKRPLGRSPWCAVLETWRNVPRRSRCEGKCENPRGSRRPTRPERNPRGRPPTGGSPTSHHRECVGLLCQTSYRSCPTSSSRTRCGSSSTHTDSRPKNESSYESSASASRARKATSGSRARKRRRCAASSRRTSAAARRTTTSESKRRKTRTRASKCRTPLLLSRRLGPRTRTGLCTLSSTLPQTSGVPDPYVLVAGPT